MAEKTKNYILTQGTHVEDGVLKKRGEVVRLTATQAAAFKDKIQDAEAMAREATAAAEHAAKLQADADEAKKTGASEADKADKPAKPPANG